MTESLTPRAEAAEVRYQPSLLSVPTAAATVAPEDRRRLSARTGRPKRAARRKLWFFPALAVLAGAVGASALGGVPRISAQVQSGSPGFRQSSTGHDLRWQKQAITVYLDASLARVGPGANEAVIQAFGQWLGSHERLPALSFDTGKTSSVPRHDGQSTVSYGPITAAGHERDLAITVTYSNEKSGEIVEADIILNALYPIGVLTPKPASSSEHDDRQRDGASHTGAHDGEDALDCQNRYDVQNVTTHEVGHFFGLGEDPVEAHATMFQTISKCETHKRVLARTDVGAVSTLYASSSAPEAASEAGGRACSFGGVPASGGTFWVSSAIFGLSLLRRRRGR